MVILESDDELEGGRPGGRSRHAQTLKQERRAPKRYEKLYLVTVSKSKSGSWQTAKVRSCRRRTWRSCEGCRTSLESCEDEKAKTRRSPWRVGAHERVKSNYDCDLVVDVLGDSISLQEVLTVDDVEGAPDPVRGGPRTGRPTGCQIRAGPTARWDTVCMSKYGYMRMQISPSICVVCRCHPQSAWWQTMNTIETIRHRRVLCCSC